MRWRVEKGEVLGWKPSNYISKTTFNCHHIFNKSAQGEEANFESCLLYFYTLSKPNKSVHLIALQKYKMFLVLDQL